jgi:hypothetical protein
MNVFLAFLFFLGWALVVACRIDWNGIEGDMIGCDLDTAIEDVVSLLRGATSDRGCAIVCFAMLDGCRVYGKFIGVR